MEMCKFEVCITGFQPQTLIMQTGSAPPTFFCFNICTVLHGFIIRWQQLYCKATLWWAYWHACDPIPWAEAEVPPGVQGQCGLHSAVL